MATPGITWVYNPVVRTMVGIAMPVYTEYVARVFDLTAYMQLVRAQLEVRLANVASDAVPAFLAGAGAETMNPYDNKPFAWDPASRSVSFTPMNPKPWRNWSFKAEVPPPTIGKAP